MIVTLKTWLNTAGWTRYTFDQNVTKGFPFVSRPDSRGGDWQIDTIKGIDWVVREAISDRSLPAEVEKLDSDEQLARLRKEQADKAALDNAKERRELIRRAPIEAALAAQDQALKDRLLMVPVSAAAEALAAGQRAGVPGIADVYERHINRALADLASAELVPTLAH